MLHVAALTQLADGSADTQSVVVQGILGTGMVGIFFIMLVNKWFIVPRYYADEQIAQRDATIAEKDAEIEDWKAQTRDLQKAATEQLLPLVIEAVGVQKEYTKVIQESVRQEQFRRAALGGGGLAPPAE